MFCPKCGKEDSGELTNCTECNFAFSKIPSDDKVLPTPKSASEAASTVGKPRINYFKLTCFSIIALIVLVMLFTAASKLNEAGVGISKIKSVGGKTLEEAYYLKLGFAYQGYALITRALGLFFASVLVWLGLKKE